MSRLARRLLIAAALLLIVGVVVALVVLPRLVDPERYRGRIEAAATEALGRPVTFTELDVSLRPLGLRVDGIEVAALPGEPAGEALRADSLRVGARFGPLLRGRLEVTSLTIERPVVRVVRTADGAWAVPLPPEESPGATRDEASAAPAVSVDEVRLTDGRLELVDAGGATLLVVDSLDANVRGFGAPGAPTTVEAEARVQLDPVLDARIVAEIHDARAVGPDAPWVSAELGLRGARGGDRIDAVLRLYDAGDGRAEVELRPSTLSGDSLIRLVPALLDPPPITILAAGPTDLSGRVEIPLGEGAEPRVDLEATLRDMRLDAGFARPLEAVFADVALTTDRVRLTGFRGRLGASDVAGTIEIEPTEIPQLTVDLRSERLDLDELLAAISGPSGPDAAGAASASTPLPRVRGELRIASGTLDTIAFTQTETAFVFADDRLQLDPLSTRLYDGTFDGRLGVDLSEDPPAIELRGTTAQIDLGPLTADAFGMPNLLAGRLDSEIDSRMSGLDVPQLLASALGRATISVGEGVVGTLDLIERVSEVAGVFGERSMTALSRKVGTNGTPFHTALGRIELDRGTMTISELAIGAAPFDLGGTARVDMLQGTLDGRFVLRLSPAISATMRAEQSKAAELFWNRRSERVEIPFTLAGPFSRPIPGIDLRTAAGTAIRDRAEDELRAAVGQRLGLPAPTGPAPAPAAVDAAPPDPTRLGSRIDGHRWRGSLLARDLQLDGVLHGPGLASATLVARDARGLAIIDRAIPELATHLEQSAEPAAPALVTFRVKIDGEKLLVATFPLTVVVTLTDTAGTSTETRLDVER